MKVIHLPSATGGNSYGLSRGERGIGLESDVLVMFNNKFRYPADRFVYENPPANFVGKLAAKLNIPALMKELRSIAGAYDVFHFNYGSSLIDLWMLGLPLMDLPYFRKNGKIAVTYNGCDARQKYRTMKRVDDSACHNEDCLKLCRTGALDVINRMKIRKFDKYADVIFALNPDLLYFLPERARFLPYTIAEWSNIKSSPKKTVRKKINIVHAPTSRVIKGTDIIISAVEKVNRKYGDKIELHLVENVPQKQAFAMYNEADLAIDQIRVGYYGAFAVEAMKIGRPVMAYIRDEDLKFMPDDMARQCSETIIGTNRHTIFDKLCEIVENPDLLKTHAEASLDYVNRWHDPGHVAGITKAAYES